MQGVSTLDLGQDTVMEAADQEVVQPRRPCNLKPFSTVGLPDAMPQCIYEVSTLQLEPVRAQCPYTNPQSKLAWQLFTCSIGKFWLAPCTPVSCCSI